MQNDWIYEYKDYRKVLDHQIQGEHRGRGYRSLMARAAGCQPAYLSQILAGAVQMTPEQASGLSDLWNFSELESDYFLTLVHLGRAGRQSLSDRLNRKLDRLKAQHEFEESMTIQAEKESYSREKALFYYLDWVPSAVHLCLMLNEHNQSDTIARRLKIENETALLALQVLEDLGIADKEKAHWRLTTKSLHASDQSLLAPHHHRNWREKAIEYFRKGGLSSNLHFTSVVCLDRKAFMQIREDLTRLIESSRRTIIPAPEETLACMNIDWFEI